MTNRIELMLKALKASAPRPEEYDTLNAYRNAISSHNKAIAAGEAELRREPDAWVEVVDSHEGPYNFNGMSLLDSGKHYLYARKETK